MKVKKIIASLLLFIIVMSNIMVISYAAPIEITKEDLEEELPKVQEESIECTCRILGMDIPEEIKEKLKEITYTVTEDTITIKHPEIPTEQSVKYTIENGKMKLVGELPVKQGIEYDTFDSSMQTIEGVMSFVYGIVAKKSGLNDLTGVYNYWFYLDAVYVNSRERKYMVTDFFDEGPFGSMECMSTESFKRRVLEYVDSEYKNFNYSDADKYNTFTYRIDIEDKTNSSCNLVTTVTIDLNANYSVLKDYEWPEEDTGGSSSTFPTTTIPSETERYQASNEGSTVSSDKTTTKEILPKAGRNTIFMIIILVIIIVMAKAIRLKKYKDIK